VSIERHHISAARLPGLAMDPSFSIGPDCHWGIAHRSSLNLFASTCTIYDLWKRLLMSAVSPRILLHVEQSPVPTFFLVAPDRSTRRPCE